MGISLREGLQTKLDSHLRDTALHCLHLGVLGVWAFFERDHDVQVFDRRKFSLTLRSYEAAYRELSTGELGAWCFWVSAVVRATDKNKVPQ